MPVSSPCTPFLEMYHFVSLLFGLPFALSRVRVFRVLLPTETGRLSSASWHVVAGVLSAEVWK